MIFSKIVRSALPLPCALILCGLPGMATAQPGVLLDLPETGYIKGCTPSAIGAIFGYYDRYGYQGYSFSNLIPGGVAEADISGSHENRQGIRAVSLDGQYVEKAGHLASQVSSVDDIPVPLGGYVELSQNGNVYIAFEPVVPGSDNDPYRVDTLLGKAIASAEYAQDTWVGDSFQLYQSHLYPLPSEIVPVRSFRTSRAPLNSIAGYIGTTGNSSGDPGWVTPPPGEMVTPADSWGMMEMSAGWMRDGVMERYPLWGMHEYLYDAGYISEADADGDHQMIGKQTTSNLYETPEDRAAAFGFADYKAEIDRGAPVLLHLNNHVIVGCGYEETDGKNIVHAQDSYLHGEDGYKVSFEWEEDVSPSRGAVEEVTTITLDTAMGVAPPPSPEIGISTTGTVVNIEWESTPGTSYLVQYSTNLLHSTGWIDLQTDTGDGSNIRISEDPASHTDTRRFYRVIQS